MNLNYSKGSSVVVTIFDKHKVGKVVDRAISKKGVAHTIEMEDGNLYESIFVNDKNSSVYINSSLTTVFVKSHEDGDNETEV